MKGNFINNEKKHVFISHATKDDDFVKKLRIALERLKIPVWVDSRNLRGGSKLKPEIEQAIANAKHTIAILSLDALNSEWVQDEIKKSLEVEKDHPDGYKTIPILLPGIKPAILRLLFGKIPVGISIKNPGNLSQNMPEILSALGYQLPNDKQTENVELKPVAELLLELEDPLIKTVKGESRAYATARVSFDPKIAGQKEIESKRFNFRSPFGPIEFDEISWYIEEFYRWPVGVFKSRAKKTEEKLPELGRALYEAVIGHPLAIEAVSAWKACANKYALHFSVKVDRELSAGATKKKKEIAAKAATKLLSIPWELLHDDGSYLIRGGKPVGIKRRLPNRKKQDVSIAELPIRILLVTARPEDEMAGYIDHRASAIPLVNAVENLGEELVSLKVCSPATFPAMMDEIEKSKKAGEPFDVIHFDGHGVYNERTGLGALCFEEPEDKGKLYLRRSKLIYADELGESLHEYRIPLMFLEACQTAMTDEKATASVATTLLEKGVASVIAMTHSVLVTTASKFVETFYKKIAHGARVGKAVLDAQNKLALDTYRGKITGAGELHLKDWFVPVLYQDETDPQLFTHIPAKNSKLLNKKTKTFSLGKIAEEKEKIPHKFVGRSRELLALQRLLAKENYATVRGQGGAGKTAIALELAHWLVISERFKKAAFVSVENLSSVQSILNEIAAQLLPSFSAQQQADPKLALPVVQRALNDDATIIVIDNLESILPDKLLGDKTLVDDKLVKELFDLCKSLLESETTRIVFTTREELSVPFANNEINLGALSKVDAIALVSNILKEEGMELPANDSGNTPEEIENLVNAVNRHARALVLLTNEIVAQGVLATTNNLTSLMASLHKRFPNEREKSLYASIELSLRRLPKNVNDKLKVLALFEGGVHLSIWANILNIKFEEIVPIAAQLINVGLAEPKSYNHLQLDPALPSYMLTFITETEKEGMQKKWAKVMIALVNYLYGQLGKDAKIAAHLTILELPNLLNLLDYIKDKYSPEEVVDTAGSIEQLIANLHKPNALKKVVQIRETANNNIKEWGKAAFEAERMKIERFEAEGNLQAAFDTAQKLLQKCLDKGEDAYSSADYDIALAYFYNGRIISSAGSSEKAIDFLEQAIVHFKKLADAGDKDAEGMMSKSLTEKADCLIDLGRLDKAEKTYKAALEINEKLNDKRAVAVSKGQLGTVYMYQKKYKEAIEAYEEAKKIFEKLGEDQYVSVAYHQIAMVYEENNNFKAAEKAYRQALAIIIKIKDKNGEATSLNQLGILYKNNGYFEEAVVFYRQACDIYIVLEDLRKEGALRNNLANTLIKLKRYNEARDEINRAIECDSHFGHAAQPWTAFGTLYNLEIATGNTQEAEQAWEKAFSAYLSYRKDGGYAKSNLAEIAEMFKAGLKQGNTGELEAIITKAAGMDMPNDDKLFFSKLKLILNGNRDISLASDTGLFVLDAVELYLLLEEFGANEV